MSKDVLQLGTVHKVGDPSILCFLAPSCAQEEVCKSYLMSSDSSPTPRSPVTGDFNQIKLDVFNKVMKLKSKSQPLLIHFTSHVCLTISFLRHAVLSPPSPRPLSTLSGRRCPRASLRGIPITMPRSRSSQRPLSSRFPSLIFDSR